MAVPNIFANATVSIPLSQLDNNFATAITLGNTAVVLGNTYTTLGNLILTNANVTTQSAGNNSNVAASTAYVDAYFASGTFTPTDASGASLSFTSPVGFYRRSGNAVHVWGSLTYPATASGANGVVGSLPFTSANLSVQDGYQGVVEFNAGGGAPGSHNYYSVQVAKGAATFSFQHDGGQAVLNSELATYNVNFQFTYPI